MTLRMQLDYCLKCSNNKCPLTDIHSFINMFTIKAQITNGTKCTNLEVKECEDVITDKKLLTFLSKQLEESFVKMLEIKNRNIIEWDSVDHGHGLVKDIKIHIPDLDMKNPSKHPFFVGHLKHIENRRKQENIKANRNSVKDYILQKFAEEYEWEKGEKEEFEKYCMESNSLRYSRKVYKKKFLQNKYSNKLEEIFTELKENPNINVLSWFYNNDYDDPHNNLFIEYTCSRIKNEPLIYDHDPKYLSNKYLSKDIYNICLNHHREFKYFGENKDPIVIKKDEDTLYYKNGILTDENAFDNYGKSNDVIISFMYISMEDFKYDDTEHSYWKLIEIN
jgi:hypothetical protein